MGFNFTPTLYSKMADMVGLDAQDKSLYDRISTGSIISVDLSLDEIVALTGTGNTPS